MARVFRRAASAFATRAPSRAAKRKNRKHKVIMEAVTQEKKKLRSVISFEAKAPPGYTFIPAGNPQFTNACKETCRKVGLKVFAVSTTPHMHTHNLSQHVHRIGYHFPSAVVATVCMDLGLYLTATGKVMPVYTIGNNGTRRRSNSDVSQITINTEARDVIRDLFPNIPDKDLNQIIKTAFQKGQRKVGTAVELPLARRAQLAVVAHIRHVYTNYDRLLKTASFHEARSLVEEPTLARLVEWRGDDENGKKVLEDVFREVIVISDDEDSDIEEEAIPESVGRDQSVEIISVSSNAQAEELHTKPVNYGNPSMRESLRDLSDDEAPPGFRFVSRAPRKSKIDRRGFSRYQAWDRAINRYRNEVVTDKNNLYSGSTGHRMPAYPVSRLLQESIPIRTEPAGRQNMVARHVSVTPLISSPRNPGCRVKASLLNPVGDHPHELHPLTVPSFQGGPDVVHLSNSSLPERGPTSRREKAGLPAGDFPNAHILVNSPRDVREYGEGPFGRRFGAPVPLHNRTNLNPQDHALPSIEVPHSPLLEARRAEGEHIDRRTAGGFSIRPVTPGRHRLEGFYPGGNAADRADFSDQNPKRRRLGCDETARYAHHPDSCSEAARSIASAAHKETYVGPRHIPLGQTSIQDEILMHRKYAALDDRPYLTARQPERVQDPTYSKDLGPNSGFSVNRKHTSDSDTRAFSHRHQLELYADRRSPKPTLPRAFSGVNYFVSEDNTLADPFPHSSNFREGHIVYDDRSSNIDYPRPSTVADSRLSTWSKANDPIVVANGVDPRRQIYSNGFVRPIDLRNPGTLESTMQHPQSQTNRVEQTFSYPVRVRRHNDRNRNELSHNAALIAVHDKPNWDTRTTRPAHEVDLHDTGYQSSGRLHDFAPATRHFEMQHQGPLDSERQAYGQPRAAEQRHPAYERRVRRPPSHYSVPEGNAIIIVD